ncbi:hypothetical protein [Stenotrophomonas sp. NPDC077659]|uniref:hypothetical protein n=1 Tax=Stenotrophomonas sp. NPDC077659 TaxID=3390694 RepID=UPI003CFD967E
MNRSVCALTLMIALASLTTTSAASSPLRIIHTVTIDELPMHTADARSALEWVKRHAPASFAPFGFGKVSVERGAFSSPHGRTMTAQASSDLPGKLPDSGVPGEVYKVENVFPDGTIQTWEFRWVQPSTGHGGGWEVIAYSFRQGSDPVNAQ